MNVAELNEPVKWFPVCPGSVETLVRPQQLIRQQQTVIEHSSDPFLGVNSRSELLDQDSDSWDDEEEEDDFSDEEENEDPRADDLLAFAERATSRLRSFICRNEGREDYRPVYEEDSSYSDTKCARDIYYSDLLNAARFNGESTLGNERLSVADGESVPTSRPSALQSVSSTISRPSRDEFEISNSTCHWHCTGLANKSRGLGPLEELFTLIGLPAPPPLMTTTNDSYDRSLEEHRNSYYYDEKMYELLMANEADATSAFWNGTCERSDINNLSDFPFI